ncbi:hypothetical protein DTO195F2_8735 [Paecilomyces variotii]|nr:hypothetical protein DTO195F2_8735 [Paecilomyces variotii]KAJ9373390.1 hypothetical protein DTO282E5_1841 [Paecilomyces variotii]
MRHCFNLGTFSYTVSSVPREQQQQQHQHNKIVVNLPVRVKGAAEGEQLSKRPRKRKRREEFVLEATRKQVRAEYAAELGSKCIAVPSEEDTEQMDLVKPKKTLTPGQWREMRYVNEPGYVMNLEYGQHFGYVTWENYLK